MARYIDADEAEYTVLHLDVDVAKHKCKDYESYINGANQFRHQVKVALRHTPTADVEEVRRGEWVDRKFIKIGGLTKAYPSVECSKCGMLFCDIINNHKVIYQFCPNCGAKMDGGKEE